MRMKHNSTTTCIDNPVRIRILKTEVLHLSSSDGIVSKFLPLCSVGNSHLKNKELI